MIEGERLTVDCPECRQVTRVQKNGVTTMKTNFRVRSLAEKHKEHVSKKEAESATKSRVDQKDTEQEIKDARILCSEHSIIIDFFCINCRVAGCSTCMINKHQGEDHDLINVASVHKEQKEQLSTIFQQMDNEIQECIDSIQDLDTLQESMEKYLEKQHLILSTQLEITIREVKDDVQRLKKQLDSIEQPKLEKVREERNRLQRLMQDMKDIKSSTQTTVDTCACHEYVEQHAAVAESVTCGLGKDCKASSDLDPVIGKARFRVNNIITLGSVSQIKQCKLVVKEELGILWCDNNNSVAITAHGFLAVCLRKNVIRIYRRQLDSTHKKETSITLSRNVTTDSPRCIAVSADGKFLVARGVCLETYSLTGEYEGTCIFTQGPNENGKDICERILPSWVVSGPSGLLVADYLKSMIVRFTHNRIFVDAIAVPFQPLRAALLLNEQVVVSNWMENQICMIDLTSKQVLRTVEIHNACAICYHEQSDSILV